MAHGRHHGKHHGGGHHLFGLAFLASIPGYQLLLLGFVLCIVCGL